MSTGSNPEPGEKREESGGEEDESDMILAVCLFVLLTINWSFLKEFGKQFTKEAGTNEKSLIGYMIRSFAKSPGLNHIGTFILPRILLP